MKKSILTIVSIGALLHFNIALAEEPHIVPTPDCPAGQTCCPLEIYCSYNEGCGDTSSWSVHGQPQLFEGVKQLRLYNISAWLSSHADNTYYTQCVYSAGEENDFISLSVEITEAKGSRSIPQYKLNGNWEYSGFIRQYATCITNNPLDCRAIQVNSITVSSSR